MTITLKINGKTTKTDSDPEMPLLWFIRDEVGLVGTKFGCGIAQCGACTVHVDGTAVRSCITAIEDVDGSAITTVEGVAKGDKLHALQKAWVEFDVPQCGYCQAGQIMSAAALLAETPKPTDDDIDAAMNGNLCRCGTYPRIRAAIHKAAKEG